MDLSVVTQLRDLAKEPINREIIVKDQGCLPGLVLMLDNQDQKVVEIAIETLGYLAECEKNRSIMWSELGLTISLNCISDATGSSEKARKMSADVIQKIRPTMQATPAARRKLPTVPNTSRRTYMPKPAAPDFGPAKRNTLGPLNSNIAKGQTSFFKPNTNKNARTVTLQVIGLTDLYARGVLERELLKMKGVVSFTIDMGKARVAIRALSTLSVEMITGGIQRTKLLSAQQIVKNEEGHEVVLSFGQAPAGVRTGSHATHVPRYLDDEVENQPESSTKAVAMTDGITTGVSGWLTSAISGFSNTFHW